MKIMYLAMSPTTSAYYRCTLPARHLEANGMAITGVFDDISRAKEADIVVVQRLCNPDYIEPIKELRKKGKKVIYELDDDLFNYPESQEYEKVTVSKAQKQTVDIIRILRNCDAATVSTQSIADTIKELVDIPVYVIPNCIDLDDYPSVEYSHRDPFIIGWAGGHYHFQDLAIIEDQLCRILDKFPHVTLAMVGFCPERIYKQYRSRLIVEPFSPMREFFLKMSLLKFDIGLAPLHKTKLGLGRSNLRMLHYAALKIPTMCSDYGEYGALARDSKSFFLTQDNEWFNNISMRIDQKNHSLMAGHAYDYVAEHYDISKNVKRWMNAYSIIMDSSKEACDEKV